MLTKSDKQFILGAIEKSREEQTKELAEIKKELKNEMALSQDVIIGRLDNIDQELTMTTGHRDMIEDQNARLSALEKIHPRGKHAS